METRTLFLDESGKTGSMRLNPDTLSWNFSQQPLFGLCGITVKESAQAPLEQFVRDTIAKYRIQGELKSTKTNVQKNSIAIATNLVELFNQHDCKTYIEIVDKKFCIAMMVTDYCILPYYDSPICEEWLLCKRIIANEIYHIISDELLCKIATFFDENTQDIPTLIYLCEELKVECQHDHQICRAISQTIDSLQHYKNLGLKKSHLFPLADLYNGGYSSVAIAPQINCINNIMTRLLHSGENIDRIVHDKISDLSEAISCNVDLHNTTIRVSFEDSRHTPILQIADIIGGFTLDCAKKILYEQNAKIEAVFANIIFNNVNFVASSSHQRKLFDKTHPSKFNK